MKREDFHARLEKVEKSETLQQQPATTKSSDARSRLINSVTTMPVVNLPCLRSILLFVLIREIRGQLFVFHQVTQHLRPHPADLASHVGGGDVAVGRVRLTILFRLASVHLFEVRQQFVRNEPGPL